MAVTLLKNVSTTGFGREFIVSDKTPFQKHTIQVVDNSTTATAIVVYVQGSLDDVNWHNLAEYTFTADDLSASAAMFHITEKYVKYVRINLITYTGGTDLTAFYRSVGY